MKGLNYGELNCSRHLDQALLSLIFATRSGREVALLWKILAFRSFYSFQVIRIRTVAVASLGRPLVSATLDHHSSMLPLLGH